MSTKRYRSGAAIQSQIEKLLKEREDLADRKLEVLTDAVQAKFSQHSDLLIELSDSEIKEAVKYLSADFDQYVEEVRKAAAQRKQVKEAKKEASEKSVSESAVQTGNAEARSVGQHIQS